MEMNPLQYSRRLLEGSKIGDCEHAETHLTLINF